MNFHPPSDHSEHKISGEQAHVFEGWARVFPLSVRRSNDGTWEVTALWGRLALGAMAALALAWAALMGGAWVFLRYERDFTAVSYPRMLLLFLPSRWKAFQVARGDALIKEAQDDYANGKIREAYYDVQIGVPKSPGNLQGRLLLAKFWSIVPNQSEKAEKLLLEGLAWHSDNEEYLDQLFQFLLQQQQDQTVIETAEKLLAQGTETDRRRPLIARPEAAGEMTKAELAERQRRQRIAWAEATAHFNRGRYDQAENLMNAYNLGEFREGLMLDAAIDWDRGERETAINHLRSLARLYPKDDEIYGQLAGYLRASGRETEAKTESFTRSVANPRDPLPRIDLLRSDKLEGNEAELSAGFDSIERDFATNNQVLIALADFAADNGDVVHAREIYRHCSDDTTNLLNREYPALMVAEAMVVAKDYQGALDFMQRLEAANPGWSVRFASIFDGLKTVAAFGKGDEEDGKNLLANFLTKPNLRADKLIAVSNRLLGVGQREQARLVLAQAVKDDPLNQAALTSLVQLDVDFGDARELGADLHHLIQMRKPSRAVLETAYAHLGSDRFLFSPDRAAMLAEVRTALQTVAGPATKLN